MKAKRVISSMIAVLIMVSVIMAPANASSLRDGLAMWYDELKESSKSTEYGTLVGEILVHVDYNDNCSFIDVAGYTYVDSDYTMRKVTTRIECMRTSTGVTESGWTGSHSTENSNEDAGWLTLYSLASGERITIYTSHQILYTNAHVLYQVAQTTGVEY